MRKEELLNIIKTKDLIIKEMQENIDALCDRLEELENVDYQIMIVYRNGKDVTREVLDRSYERMGYKKVNGKLVKINNEPDTK